MIPNNNPDAHYSNYNRLSPNIIISYPLAMAPKTVLITGATRGIGFETAKVFYQSPYPYHVFFGARSESSGNQSIKRLKAEVPNSTNTVSLLLIDVESDDSIERAAESVSNSHGSLDFLINNAGKQNQTQTVFLYPE